MEEETSLSEKVKDLIKQATEERSHYYVKSVLEECLKYIEERDEKVLRLKKEINKNQNITSRQKINIGKLFKEIFGEKR